MNTTFTLIWIFVFLFLLFILGFCLYVIDALKKISKSQKIIQHQNEIIYESLLKISS